MPRVAKVFSAMFMAFMEMIKIIKIGILDLYMRFLNCVFLTKEVFLNASTFGRCWGLTVTKLKSYVQRNICFLLIQILIPHTHTHTFSNTMLTCIHTYTLIHTRIHALTYTKILTHTQIELHSRYYVYILINIIGKGMKPLVLPAMG